MRTAAKISVLSAGLALGACSMPDFDSMRAPDVTTFFRPRSVTSFRDKPIVPVTANDLVDAGGRCPGPMMQGEPGAEPAGAVPMVAGGITLEMTECEVVQRAGATQNVEIGADQGGERIATLTFLGGPRPGIYHFTGGRLKSMDRGAEPPPQAAPTKRAAKPKKKTAER